MCNIVSWNAIYNAQQEAHAKGYCGQRTSKLIVQEYIADIERDDVTGVEVIMNVSKYQIYTLYLLILDP